MESQRWIRIAPLAVLVAAGAVGLGRPVATVAGDPPWDPPPCPGTTAAGPPGGHGAAWYRLDPLLDRAGTLVGRRLVVGLDGDAGRRLDLAPESFASGPVDGLVLTGEDGGRRSRLRLLDPARGCATMVADEAAVIRSAVMTADGQSIYEHHVDRATRADLGIWRRDLGAGESAGAAAAVRVLDGLGPDPVLGRTFVTDLLAGADGRLIVSSCAERACRVRVLDAGTGRVSGAVRGGPALGVVGGRLIALAACPGLPCGVEAVDLATGRRVTLLPEAGAAVLGGRDGVDIVYEAADGRVASVNALTGRRGATTDAGGVPVRGGSTATSGAEAPPGVVVVGAGGRPDGTALRVLDPQLGRVMMIKEATR